MNAETFSCPPSSKTSFPPTHAAFLSVQVKLLGYLNKQDRLASGKQRTTGQQSCKRVLLLVFVKSPVAHSSPQPLHGSDRQSAARAGRLFPAYDNYHAPCARSRHPGPVAPGSLTVRTSSRTVPTPTNRKRLSLLNPAMTGEKPATPCPAEAFLAFQKY